MSAAPRVAGPRLAAVWFADLCGYSRLSARNEPIALALVELLQRLAAEEVPRQGGRIVKFIGDAVLAEFPSVRGAARAALSLRNAFQQCADTLARGSDLRVGLHLGEISEAEDGDIYGEGVNVASRLQEEAQPGEVLVSGDVWRQLRQLPYFSAVRGGAKALRGMSTRISVYILTRTPPVESQDQGSDRISAPEPPRALSILPLVGREAELTMVRHVLDRLGRGAGGTLLLSGEAGVGKTRLAQTLAAQAEAHGYQVASGRAYPVESGVPYALIADALLPVARDLEASALSVFTRGGGAELSCLFPTLGWRADPGVKVEDAAEFKGRLLWTFTQFLRTLAARAPLVLILDDVHWADASSLELLHFVARQTARDPILIVCTYTDTPDDASSAFHPIEQSLLAIGVARLRRVEALTAAGLEQLLGSAFDAAPADVQEFSALLYEWTRGNIFFAQEILQSLIAWGRIHESEGRWRGWDVSSQLELPPTVRHAVLDRIHGLSARARTAADAAAVVGTRVSYGLLRTVTGLPEDELLTALDELRRQGILTEGTEDGSVVFDFRHPIARQVLYGELGKARCCRLHGIVAEALEQTYAGAPLEHVDDIAYHFARAAPEEHSSKAVEYLTAAGRAALNRFANREAAAYLSHALELNDARSRTHAESKLDTTDQLSESTRMLIDGLARARQRLGDYSGAIILLERLMRDTEARDDLVATATLRRRIGLDYFWNGMHDEALDHFAAGIVAAELAAATPEVARLELARGACFQELGRADDAQRVIERAHAMAQVLEGEPLRARSHRALLLLHTWIGPANTAREHGAHAIELAARTRDSTVAFFSHWSLAVLEGLTGHVDLMVRHMAEAELLAESLGSPLLRLWTDELSIEHAWSLGEWDRGIAQGERAITLARALNQRTLLPRLLVWTSVIHLARGDIDAAIGYVDEAWTISGAERAGDRTVDVHTVVPAHIGRAAYHLARLEYHDAIRTAEAGLVVADRSGYPFWAIHRLLPIICEAYLSLNDMDGARRAERRLRRDSERLGHRLGIAWSDACRGLVAWRSGDIELSAQLLRSAVESLDEIPVLPDSARLRRQLARRLMELGDREGALRELSHAYEVFERIGARPELEKAGLMFTEFGAEPPTRRILSSGQTPRRTLASVAPPLADRTTS